MSIRTVLKIIFLIAIAVGGINCDSSKADKITGPSTSGSP